jgi:hypothetical protein
MSYFWVLPVLSAIWVGVDASNLGFKRGRLGGGTLDMGVTSFVLATLLIWIVGFPCYLIARSRYVEQKNRYGYGYAAQPITPMASPYSAGVSHGVVTAAAPYGAQQTVAAPYGAQTAPPQYSPDGQWWWNGQAWVPAHGGNTPA